MAQEPTAERLRRRRSAAAGIMKNDTMTTAVGDEARRFSVQFPRPRPAAPPRVPTAPIRSRLRSAAPPPERCGSLRLDPDPDHDHVDVRFTHLPLNVTCDASLNFVNTDVMLVLDVTGSMADNLNGTQKIVALRDAVMALYDELRPIQTQLEANGMRLRYGVVPYSTTVNVGALLRSVNPDYIADNPTYRSRVANYDDLEVEYIPRLNPPPAVTQNYASSISQAMRQYGRTRLTGFTRPARGVVPRPRHMDARSIRTTIAGVMGLVGIRHVGQHPLLPAALRPDQHELHANYYYDRPATPGGRNRRRQRLQRAGRSRWLPTGAAGSGRGSFDAFHCDRCHRRGDDHAAGLERLHRRARDRRHDHAHFGLHYPSDATTSRSISSL